MTKHRANGEGTVRKRADGRWEARYTDTRELDPKKRLKYLTGKSQKIVVDMLKKALADVTDLPLLVNDNSKIAEWLPFWLREYKTAELRDSTFESYSRHIKLDIVPLLGHIKVKDLTGLHIQQMYNKLQESKAAGGRGLGSATVSKIKNILSGALQQAVTNRIIRNNPVLASNPPKVEDADIRILSKAEQKQLLAVLPFYNTGNMFAVALATGMRIGELCALDIRDINREQKYIDISKSAGRRQDKYTGEVSIKVGPPKTKNSIRRIPLLPSVEVMLDRQAQFVSEIRNKEGLNWRDNTLVFPTDEGHIHDLSGLRSSMERILKRAGLPHMTIHALRHTYATTALNAGVAAQNVARLLGHKDGATTLRFYAHYINGEAITQLERLEEQNISHLGITAGELERVVIDSAEALEKSDITEKIDKAILKAKNLAPKKSVEIVLSVCEDILCQPMDSLSPSDKELLLGVLAQYSMMKRQHAEKERAEKTKTSKAR
jgi:integrase